VRPPEPDAHPAETDGGLLFIEIFPQFDSLHDELVYRDLLARSRRSQQETTRKATGLNLVPNLFLAERMSPRTPEFPFKEQIQTGAVTALSNGSLLGAFE
jgi:hypothetical protein